MTELMANEASHFAQETMAAVHIQLGPEGGLKLQDAVNTKAGGEEELANQQEELVQWSYSCSQKKRKQ